jgi:hypothetical protein
MGSEWVSGRWDQLAHAGWYEGGSALYRLARLKRGFLLYVVIPSKSLYCIVLYTCIYALMIDLSHRTVDMLISTCSSLFSW